MKRVLLTGAVVVTTLVAAGAMQPAKASTVVLYHFTGTVTDSLGAPLRGATVSDGNQADVTGADGRYSLPESGTGSFHLFACRQGNLCQDKAAQVVVPQDTTVDFALQYATWGGIDHPGISTASSPVSRAVSITSGARVTGTCVTVTDSRTGSTSPASYVSTDANGFSSWAWTLSLPQATTEGVYNVSLVATECSSAKVISDTFPITYVVDNTAPTVTSAFPSGWTLPSVAIGGRFSDTGGSGVNPSASGISLDGSALHASLNFDSDLIEATATGLASGVHQAVITVVDEAGNATSSSFAFSVDSTPPALTSPTPTGTVDSTSPLLRIVAADHDSGISPTSGTFTLSNGLMSSTLTPHYDLATGTLSYQVPSTVRGASLGQFPLPDGAYTVTARVRDIAGNPATSSWSFTVRTLPV